MGREVPLAALLAGALVGAAQGELLSDQRPVFHPVFLDYLHEPVVFLREKGNTSYDQPFRDYI